MGICPKCGSPIPEDAVFCMNCGEKIETAAPEAEPTPAEITPAEENPVPASGKKPKKKKAVLLVSVLALLLVAATLANSGLFQSNIAAKAEKRIIGSWNGMFMQKGDETPIVAKNSGDFVCTVVKGGAATISFPTTSTKDVTVYLTYSPDKTQKLNESENRAEYCYEVRSEDGSDDSICGYAFVTEDMFAITFASSPKLSFVFDGKRSS